MRLIVSKKYKFKYYLSDDGYFFLNRLQIQSYKDLYQKKCLEFSYFKFGVKKIFNHYAKFIERMIREELSINSDEWVIVSRANFIHEYISGSISDVLAKELSKKLNLKHVVSYPTIDLENDVNYSKLNSFKDRQSEINKRKYLLHFPENVDLNNKNIIFIDDIINTGITINTIRDSLSKYHIKQFKVFSIAKLVAPSPGFEYKLSRIILDKKFKNKNLIMLKKLFSQSKLIVTHKLLKIIKKW
jgi:hypoxanthine phosphoribosyltransferase